MRYTPAGIPALNLQLEHESETQEAGQPRQIKVAVKVHQTSEIDHAHCLVRGSRHNAINQERHLVQPAPVHVGKRVEVNYLIS